MAEPLQDARPPDLRTRISSSAQDFRRVFFRSLVIAPLPAFVVTLVLVVILSLSWTGFFIVWLSLVAAPAMTAVLVWLIKLTGRELRLRTVVLLVAVACVGPIVFAITARLHVERHCVDVTSMTVTAVGDCEGLGLEPGSWYYNGSVDPRTHKVTGGTFTDPRAFNAGPVDPPDVNTDGPVIGDNGGQ